MRTIVASTLIILFALSTNALAIAGKGTETMRLNLEQVTFEEALNALSKASGKEVKAQGIRPTFRTNVSLNDVTFDQALKEVVKGFGVQNHALYTRGNTVNVWVLQAGAAVPVYSVSIENNAGKFGIEEVGELVPFSQEQLLFLAQTSPDFPEQELTPLTPDQLEQLLISGEAEPGPEDLQPLTPEQLQQLMLAGEGMEPGPEDLQPLTPEQMQML